MSNVVQMSRPCAYLVSRAARHCRAGRYDEAMALLSRAKNEFGSDEDIEFESARVYENIGCEHEASRSYLRVVRLGGKLKQDALFQLSYLALQRSDVRRASSYFQLFEAGNRGGISPESVSMLREQIDAESDQRLPLSRKGRARMLEHRAAQQIQLGRHAAAQRELERAVLLNETAQGLTLLACCHLLRGSMKEAVRCARRAHHMEPRRVQTLCVLSDALAGIGNLKDARRTVYLAALRAKDSEDLYAAALESAKLGEDRLTVCVTGRLLRREMFHTQGMMLRACALVNLGRLRDAARLFGRLCGLMPENSVCEAYYHMLREGNAPKERLDLGVDVTRGEGIERASQMISMLYKDPDAIAADTQLLRRVCRICTWALRSPMVGSSASTVALILMSAIKTPQSREVLEDLLCDPLADQSLKFSVLQILTGKEGFRPYYVDIDGRFVRLAAGGVCSRPVSSKENSRLLQQACDLLSPRFPDAPNVLMPVYLKYMEKYPTPKKEHEPVCVAALVYVYHLKKRHDAFDIETMARRIGVSSRLLALFIRRMLRAEGRISTERAVIETEENT